MNTITRDPVVNCTTILINLLYRCKWYLILFTSCKHWYFQFNDSQVWTFFGQYIRIKSTRRIKNVITVVSVDDFICIFCISNEVIQNLIISKIHGISFHSIYNNITVIRTDCNTYRICLCKTIRSSIQFYPCRNTINPHNHFSVFTIRQNIKFQLHIVIFTIWYRDFVLLRFQCCFLCFYSITKIVCKTGENLSFIVFNICTFINKFKVLTSFLRIISK